jgi:hypothetical protein
MAKGRLGRFASKLVKDPSDLSGLGPRIESMNPGAIRLAQGESDLDFPTSIDTLKPDHPFVVALSQLPIKVPYHSIIGDRGRGDSPNSSDGIVEYWSSHLEGAQSELIVPADHHCHHYPTAVVEMNKILHLHLRGL